MPINNDILGIYKAVFIRTSSGGAGYSYIVESAYVEPTTTAPLPLPATVIALTPMCGNGVPYL